MSPSQTRLTLVSAKNLAAACRLVTLAALCVWSSQTLGAQTVRTTAQAGSPIAVPGLATASASRAATPPAIDGRDTDAAWTTATPITAFRQIDPVEDAEPSMRTEARITHDD